MIKFQSSFSEFVYTDLVRECSIKAPQSHENALSGPYDMFEICTLS